MGEKKIIPRDAQMSHVYLKNGLLAQVWEEHSGKVYLPIVTFFPRHLLLTNVRDRIWS